MTRRQTQAAGIQNKKYQNSSEARCWFIHSAVKQKDVDPFTDPKPAGCFILRAAQTMMSST